MSLFSVVQRLISVLAISFRNRTVELKSKEKSNGVIHQTLGIFTIDRREELSYTETRMGSVRRVP